MGKGRAEPGQCEGSRGAASQGVLQADLYSNLLGKDPGMDEDHPATLPCNSACEPDTAPQHMSQPTPSLALVTSTPLATSTSRWCLTLVYNGATGGAALCAGGGRRTT
jgi:hypothetical protein